MFILFQVGLILIFYLKNVRYNHDGLAFYFINIPVREVVL